MKFALVGYGRFGKNHARTILQNKNSELYCVFENDDKLRQYACKDLDCPVFSDVNKFDEFDKIDGVIVATPASTHFNIARRFLNNSVNVLCEKPLVFTRKEAETLHEIANNKKKVLMTAYTFLSNSVYEKIKELFDSKDFGEPIGFLSLRNNYGPIRRDTGVIYDLITHDISILVDLMGCKIPSSIESSKLCLNGGDEDIASVTIKYNKFFANCLSTWLSPKKERTIRLFGSKMMIEWDDISLHPIKIYTTPEEFKDYGEYSHFIDNASSTYKEMICPIIKTSEPLMNQLNSFISLVKNKNKTFSNRTRDFIISDILEKAAK